MAGGLRMGGQGSRQPRQHEPLRMFTGPSGPGTGGWMTFTFKLEQADGTPARGADDPEHRHELANR
jgi:hypothetical protein